LAGLRLLVWTNSVQYFHGSRFVGIKQIMNPMSALSSLQNSNPLLAILCAGFTCGTLDISAALVVYWYFGRPPMRLLPGVAAGVLGSRSFQDGLSASQSELPELTLFV